MTHLEGHVRAACLNGSKNCPNCVTSFMVTPMKKNLEIDCMDECVFNEFYLT